MGLTNVTNDGYRGRPLLQPEQRFRLFSLVTKESELLGYGLFGVQGVMKELSRETARLRYEEY